MSVRAYLVHEDVKIINNKEYVHEDHEFLWNNWSQYEIWDILYPYINDMTNDDCIGEIEIVYDEWDNFKNKYNSHDQTKLNQVVNNNKEVFQTIDEYFKEGNNWITIKLY